MKQKNDWRVIVDASGRYLVVNEEGEPIATGFTSNAEAWDWIDRNSHEGRADRDRHYRIRHSDSFS